MGALPMTKRNPSITSASGEPRRERGLCGRHLHQQQAGDDRDVADGVGEEAPALADAGHQDAGDRRADHARGVEHRGVQGDGVDQVFAAHHLHEEGLPRGDVEGVDHPEQRRQHEDVPDLHGAGQRQDGQDERQQHGGRLGGDDHAVAAEAVGHDAAQRAPSGRRESGWRS